MIIVFQFLRVVWGIADEVLAFPGDALVSKAMSKGPSDLQQVSDPNAMRRYEMNAIVQFALKDLRDRSDVGTGRDTHPGLYRDSHTIFINGNDVADLSSWMPGDIVHISNPVPYARKLEVGRMHTTLPGHEYEMTTQVVQQKYGDICRIDFVHMPLRFSGVKAAIPTDTKWLHDQPAIMFRGLS